MSDVIAQPADAPPRRDQRPARPAWLVAVAALLLPGLGYVLAGERGRGIVAGTTILLLFAAGLFVGGVRVVDVPGYSDGQRLLTPDGRWVTTARPVNALLQKPWFIGQMLVGPAAFAAGYAGVQAAQNQIPKATAHVGELGTLYTAVAGMLNLLVVLDSAARAGRD